MIIIAIHQFLIFLQLIAMYLLVDLYVYGIKKCCFSPWTSQDSEDNDFEVLFAEMPYHDIEIVSIL